MPFKDVGSPKQPLFLKLPNGEWREYAGGSGVPLKMKMADGSWKTLTTAGRPAPSELFPIDVNPYWYLGVKAQDPRGTILLDSRFTNLYEINPLFQGENGIMAPIEGVDNNHVKYYTNTLEAYEEAASSYVKVGPSNGTPEWIGGRAAPLQSVIIVDLNLLDTYSHPSSYVPQGRIEFKLFGAQDQLTWSLSSDPIPQSYKDYFWNTSEQGYYLTLLPSDSYAILDPDIAVMNEVPEGDFRFQGQDTLISALDWVGEEASNYSDWKISIPPTSTFSFESSQSDGLDSIEEPGTVLATYEFGPGDVPASNYLVFSLVTKNQSRGDLASRLEIPGIPAITSLQFNTWNAIRSLSLSVHVRDLLWVST
jgi:hypothetical protein